MNKEKLIHQLFIGKVSDVIGVDKTSMLLKEAKDSINGISEGQNLPIYHVSIRCSKCETKPIEWKGTGIVRCSCGTISNEC